MAYTGEQVKQGQTNIASAYKVLGKGTATGNQTITSTASPGTDVTSLTVTCTPDGTHDVKVTVSITNPSVTSGSWMAFGLQKDGAVVAFGFLNGSNLAESWLGNFNITYVDSVPTNAAHTYKVSAWVSSGTGNTVGSGPVQNLILVEQVG